LEAAETAEHIGPRCGASNSAPLSALPAISAPCSLTPSHAFLAHVDIAEDIPVVALCARFLSFLAPEAMLDLRFEKKLPHHI
jgi:hypothetical protein